MKKRAVILASILLLLLSTTIADSPIQNEEAQKPMIAHKKNTFPEIEQALKTNPNFIEIDIRKTKDNILIAFHDSKINSKPINQLTYNQIINLNPEIPKLEAILKKFNQTNFQIHLKAENCEKPLTDLLQQLNKSRFIIISENLNSLKKIKQSNPEIKLGLILLKQNSIKFATTWLKSQFNPESLISPAKKANIEFIVPNYNYVNKKFLNTAEKHNIKVIPWTINNKDKIKKFQDTSVYAITSDTT